MTWTESSLRWYGLLLLLTVCWAPLVRLLCERLPDRGATIVRPIALLGMVYPTWLLGSTGAIPYSAPLIWATLLLAGLVGWGWITWQHKVDRAWLLALLVTEIVSVVVFFAYIWLRGFTPELINTEKPMDAAFLASSARTLSIPPPDPWFAGEPINYYYLGYLVHGTLSRLTGIPATTGFNLALATTVSTAFAAAAGLGWNVVRHWYSRRLACFAGATSALLLVVVGNLYAATQLVQQPGETINASWWNKEFGIGWRSSRIVCDTVRVRNDCPYPYETINEFPFFSFLLGDLHPHVMALPFAVAALVLAFNLFLRPREVGPSLSTADWTRIGVSGAYLGSLYALNSWDFPTYLLVGLAAVWWSTAASWPAIVVLIASSVLAWSPFILGFAPPPGAPSEVLPEAIQNIPVLPRLLTVVGFHTGERTSVGEFLTIFGLPYVVALGLIVSGWLNDTKAVVATRVPGAAVGFGLITMIAAIVLPAPLLLLCGIPLAGAVWLLSRQPAAGARTIATALYALGLALVLVTEFFFIQDPFQSRMNTLFKVYYQVWILFAAATAVALTVLWTENRLARLARPAVAGISIIGIAAGLVYPILASSQWTDGFRTWSGLDGIDYIEGRDADELTAIRWLQENTGPDDILLEAAGCSYEVNGDIPLNRASAFSGVPTVIGWSGHERQWRGGQSALLAEIGQREADVAAIFADPSSTLIDDYGVTLLYLGRYEQGDWQHVCAAAGPYQGVSEPGYPGPGWSLAFHQGDIRIYRRFPEPPISMLTECRDPVEKPRRSAPIFL